MHLIVETPTSPEPTIAYDSKRPLFVTLDFNGLAASDRLSDEAFRDECAMRAMAALMPITPKDSYGPLGLHDRATAAARAYDVAAQMVAERQSRMALRGVDVD